MTAAQVSSEEVAALVALLDREVDRSARADGAARVAGPLLDAALYAPLRDFLSRPGKEFRGRLSKLAFELAGGCAGGLPVELPLAIEILHAGSLIVDDIEDDSEQRRGGAALHKLVGMPVAMNAGNWLYFWAARLLAQSGLSASARLVAHERMGESLLSCHEGQALDLTLQIGTLAQADVEAAVRATSQRKTGSLVGLAGAFGAIAAGAEPGQVTALERFGCELGVGLQILDDLSGILNPSRADKGQEDLLHQRATWVWGYLARDLSADEYGELREQLRWAGEDAPDAGERVRTLIERLRFRLGVTGVSRARRHLERTISVLTDEVGDGPWRRALEDELGWLERRFLEVRG